MKDNEIKALTPITCPHCNKPIVIEFITSVPNLTSILTPEMIESAKKDAIQRLKALTISKTIIDPLIVWIENPETIISPTDVVDIINSAKDESSKIT